MIFDLICILDKHRTNRWTTWRRSKCDECVEGRDYWERNCHQCLRWWYNICFCSLVLYFWVTKVCKNFRLFGLMFIFYFLKIVFFDFNQFFLFDQKALSKRLSASDSLHQLWNNNWHRIYYVQRELPENITRDYPITNQTIYFFWLLLVSDTSPM